jgi:predicted SprT family Zn-dependent metalloprotease
MNYPCQKCKTTTKHKPRHFNAEKEGKKVVLECTVCRGWSINIWESDWDDFKKGQREMMR